MSWTIDKQFSFCYGHRVWSQLLDEDYCATGDTHCKCRFTHGHEGLVHIFLSADDLERGMVTDFKHLGWMKNFLDDNLDHKFIIDRNDPIFMQIINGRIVWKDVVKPTNEAGTSFATVEEQMFLPQMFEAELRKNLSNLDYTYLEVEYNPVSVEGKKHATAQQKQIRQDQQEAIPDTLMKMIPVVVPGTETVVGHKLDTENLNFELSEPMKEFYEGFFIVNFLPTSENLSKYLYDIASEKMSKLGVNVTRVDWWETPKSRSSYSGENK